MKVKGSHLIFLRCFFARGRLLQIKHTHILQAVVYEGCCLHNNQFLWLLSWWCNLCSLEHRGNRSKSGDGIGLASAVQTVCCDLEAIIAFGNVPCYRVSQGPPCSWAPCPLDLFLLVFPSLLQPGLSPTALLGWILSNWTDGASACELRVEKQNRGMAEVATWGICGKEIKMIWFTQRFELASVAPQTERPLKWKLTVFLKIIFQYLWNLRNWVKIMLFN